MALPVRKSYKGAPVTTTISAGISDSATTVNVASVNGWPTSFPYYAVIDPGTVKEEKVRVTNISTLQLTVVRAQDDTTAVSHDTSASIYPVFTAIEADEANQIASAMTTKGDIISTDGSSINRLAVGGTNAHVLQVDSAQTNGIKWGQVATNGIADGATTLAKLATAVQNFLVPVGTIVAYGGSSAPTGWLLCDGSTFNATTYSSLNTVLGGNTLPDLRGKFAMGKTTSGTGSTLLGTGGSNTILEANLPVHSHTFSATTSTKSLEYRYGGLSGGGTIAFLRKEDGSGTSVTSGAPITDHNHTVSGTTSSTGSGTAYFQPFVAVNYIIKHD